MEFAAPVVHTGQRRCPEIRIPVRLPVCREVVDPHHVILGVVAEPLRHFVMQDRVLRKQLQGLSEDIDAEAATAAGEDWSYAKVFVQSMLRYMDAEMVDAPKPKAD